MKHEDFYIGLEFVGSGGLRWRCTDVGTRTIVAIPLDREDPLWYQGPPYMAKEIVFDEHELKHCHLTEVDAIAAAIDELKDAGHPGYPSEVVDHMVKARCRDAPHLYPSAGVLRVDRRRPDGEILHPYAGRREGDTWVIELYLPFRGTYEEMAERDFIALPMVKADDIRARAERR